MQEHALAENDGAEGGLDLVLENDDAADVRNGDNLEFESRGDGSAALVGDAGLAYLEAIPNLETLTLSETRITDEGLESIGNLDSLKSLNLSSTAVGDDGLAHLRSLRNLQDLDLIVTSVSDEGLIHLEQMKSLTSLALSYTEISDAGLAHLKDLNSFPATRRTPNSAGPGPGGILAVRAR